MLINKPITVNKLVLNNRIAMVPMATGKASNDGFVSDELIEYYCKRAKNDSVGLIETEHCYVDISGRAGSHQISISKDEDIPSLRKLTEAVHKVGSAKIFAQISHCGGAADPNDTNGISLAPSSQLHPWMKKGIMPKELTKSEIEFIIDKFAEAANRAKKAGFDGIEIHAAHGYLLNQFTSSYANHRTDEYGGSIENRCLIIKQILEKTRLVVGYDYPICVRLGTIDQLEGGTTFEETVNAAKLLEQWTADMISISGGMKGYTRRDWQGAGFYRDYSKAIKEKVKIPVLMAGMITTKSEAEELLENNEIDIAGIGRAILKDENWAIKD